MHLLVVLPILGISSFLTSPLASAAPAPLPAQSPTTSSAKPAFSHAVGPEMLIIEAPRPKAAPSETPAKRSLAFAFERRQIHNADFGASPQNRTLSDLSTTPPQAQNNAKRQLPPLGSPLNPGSATNNGFVPSPPEPDTPTNEPDELENDELEYEEEPERRVESAPPAQPPNPFAPVSNLFQAVPGALSAVSSVYYTTPLSTVDPNAVGGAKDTPSPDETEAARERFKSKMAHEHGPPSNMREQAQRSSSPTAAPPTTPQSRPQKRGDLDLDFNKIIHEPQDPNATPQEQDEDRRKGFVNIDSNHKPEDNDNAQYQQRGSHFSHGHGGQTQESGRPAADRAGGRVPDSREGSGLADHGRGGGMGNGPQ